MGTETTPANEYVAGVVTVEVEGKDSEAFHTLVDRAAAWFEVALADKREMRTENPSFEGPHLTPGAGAYAPLDFL